MPLSETPLSCLESGNVPLSGRFRPRCFGPGSSHSREPCPLLAIPDAPPTCIRHRRRQAAVPQAARGWKPKQVQCTHSPEVESGAKHSRVPKRNQPHFCGADFFLESGNVLLSRPFPLALLRPLGVRKRKPSQVQCTHLHEDRPGALATSHTVSLLKSRLMCYNTNGDEHEEI